MDWRQVDVLDELHLGILLLRVEQVLTAIHEDGLVSSFCKYVSIHLVGGHVEQLDDLLHVQLTEVEEPPLVMSSSSGGPGVLHPFYGRVIVTRDRDRASSLESQVAKHNPDELKILAGRRSTSGFGFCTRLRH